LQRLVQLKGVVGGEHKQVEELGRITHRINEFIGSIREIADLTNLIALKRGDRGGAGRQAWTGLRRSGRRSAQLAAQSAGGLARGAVAARK
jgi:hypothetical protein